MSEIQFFSTKKNSQLILFVHGFTGNIETWNNTGGTSFPELLLTDIEIQNNFDVACYEYYSKFLDPFSAATQKFNKVKSLFKRFYFKPTRNLCIEQIASHLESTIRFRLAGYENIVLIAHSMGGLIAKKVIIDDFNKQGFSKIKLFISLAVPHQGAELATLGSLISKDIQIENLRPVGPFVNELNRNWIELKPKPVTKYFYGTYDKIVPQPTAISMDSEKTDAIAVNEDHISICKPENTDNLVFIAIDELIKDYLKELKDTEDTIFSRLDDIKAYDDELFVLKLIVADVHQSTISYAKELFLNAEIVRKKIRNKHDKKSLVDLYDKIRELYKDSYNKFLHGEPANSGLLVSEVHEKITNQDEQSLRTVIPIIKAYHKKGMLHQMANNLKDDIWWTEEKKLTKKELIDE
jgi:hypothetical protein